MVLEKTPESPLDSKIKPVDLKANQSWILVGRTDAETPIFWSSDVNSWIIGKVPDVGKDWGQMEKRASEDEIVGWHHWSNWHELGQTLGDGEEQGGLACHSLWGCKESDTTRKLNNNKYIYIYIFPFHSPVNQSICANFSIYGPDQRPSWSNYFIKHIYTSVMRIYINDTKMQLFCWNISPNSVDLLQTDELVPFI